MIAVVSADAASSVTHALTASGLPAWVAGRVTIGALENADEFVQGAKGVDGGAVRLVSDYA
jgi:phosphoribosylformylglycinamidine cyclo-ligase